MSKLPKHGAVNDNVRRAQLQPRRKGRIQRADSLSLIATQLNPGEHVVRFALRNVIATTLVLAGSGNRVACHAPAARRAGVRTRCSCMGTQSERIHEGNHCRGEGEESHGDNVDAWRGMRRRRAIRVGRSDRYECGARTSYARKRSGVAD